LNISSNTDLLDSGLTSHQLGSNQDLTLRDNTDSILNGDSAKDFINQNYLEKIKILKHA